jgi:hypothetical protein
MALDYEAAKTTLSTTFDGAEATFQANEIPGVNEKAVAKDLAAIFTSKTQAYREAFVGTILARLQDKNINLTLPYVKHGPTAVSCERTGSERHQPVPQREADS